jgi:hypothetical protein
LSASKVWLSAIKVWGSAIKVWGSAIKVEPAVVHFIIIKNIISFSINFKNN